MNLQSMSRKLLVFALTAVVIMGTAAIANAISITPRPEILLIGDEEPFGKPGHGMVSIGDTIMIRATVMPNDSLDYIVADLRKYGGSEAEMLSTFLGTPADTTPTGILWVPSCSGDGAAQISQFNIPHPDSPFVQTEHWEVWYDGGGNGDTWTVIGSMTGTLPENGETDSLRCFTNGFGDTLFCFRITNVSGICCATFEDSCDHFVFDTRSAVPADTVWRDTLVVADADSFWIDNTPCRYIGHDDPTVLVTAYALGGYFDTLSSYPPTTIAGWPDTIDYDTHWTTYISPYTRLFATEFEEGIDYFFRFVTDNSGVGPIFGMDDYILNPANDVFTLEPDTVCLNVDMRKLAHENGNDDILFLAFDAHLLGQVYADSGWWHVSSPYYAGVNCITEENGVPVDEIFEYCIPILPDTTDIDAGEELPMIWISDSGDTTWFGTFTNRLYAIDNQIPDSFVADSPTDSVTYEDIGFVADKDNAGSPDWLNPASEGYLTPDQLQVTIDLAGLFDLLDVEDGGWAFASMMGIGYDQADTASTPFGLDYLAGMHPLSPVWGTDSIDVLASPPSLYGYDQDSVETAVWIFDNAGNTFYVGPVADTTLWIDNILPFVDASDCTTDNVIWCELAEDVASYTGYANVGQPVDNIHGNPYDNRDRIVLHANLGDYLGEDEVLDVTLIDNPYCNDPIPFLYDNGVDGADAELGDKNYTGQTRIQVAGITAGVCTLDTDEDEQGFAVLVTDDALNAAVNYSCIQPKVDNEPPWMSPEHVSITFWDHPDSMGVEGDVDGNGVVTVGDKLIFEWRAQDEVIPDGEIDSVRVKLASIDPSWSGRVKLYYLWPGGIYRNWWPHGSGPPVGDLFTVIPGTVDGDTLCGDFKVWDNAGNTNGWETFCSDLVLDNVTAPIDCDEIEITITGADTVASVGDTVCFHYEGADDDVAEITINVGDLHPGDPSYVTLDYVTDHWEGCFVVQEGDIDTPEYWFDVDVFDDVGNEYDCVAGPIAADNMQPAFTCGNVLLRLWDYVDNVAFRVVNAGDNLTVVYWDADGDVVKVTADYSNYGTSIGTDGVVNLVPEFDGGALYKWGYRVDPVPEGTIDQGPGGLGTLVMVEVWDDAGNYSSGWVCPKWLPGRHGGLDPIDDPAEATEICNAACLPVDTDRPGPVDPESITFELLETSNSIANVGDRLRIIVNMGDPTAPGYDMQWESSAVQADISQYGADYEDLNDYLFLTDDGWSAGGEGDGRFSYFFFFSEDDGYTWFEGAPILPGEANLDAGDEGTKIRLRSMDDAGNFSEDWVWSDVLVLEGTGEPVPVDNEIPEIDDGDISVSFVDNDENGILDIGDEVTISVDMTDAAGGPIANVYAYLYDWGYPTMDMVPLTAQSPVYEITFTVDQNEGEFCDGDLLEDEWCSPPRELVGVPMGQPHPEVRALAQDVSDNWSNYAWAYAPYVDSPTIVEDWPFTYAWPSGVEMSEMIADTDAPDPVNWTYEEGGFDSGISTYSLPDGRIGIKMFYETYPRNTDVGEFYVYGDIDTPGEVDWDTYLGAPIPAGNVPTSRGGMRGGDYAWISDMLPEREEAYHFGVLALDNAGNMSDPDLTWITGEYADTSYFSGYAEAFNGDDHPVDMGGDDCYFLGYLNSEYYEVVYVEWYARLKDLGSGEPGPWKLFEEHGEWPDSKWDYVEPPYYADTDDLLDEFSLVDGTCYTFEIVIIPWDESGNHMTLTEAEQYATDFTYDDWPPVIQRWAVDGDPSPSAEPLVLSGSALIEAEAYDGCDMNGELTYVFYLIELGGQSLDADMWLDTQTIPAGETYTFTWDLAGYPAGPARIGLDVYDESGNMASFNRRTVAIDDTWAPGGRFAAVKMDMFSHPEMTKLVDGMSIGGSDELPLIFWVQWPGEIPSYMYDVGQVKIEYMLHGATEDWHTVAVVPDYDDTESWDDDLWYAYYFEFDTSGFEDGDQIDLKATVMDELGNEQVVTITVMIAAEAPILTIDVPEAQEVCGEMRVKGPFNITATEIDNPVDTYLALWAYKRSDEPDIDPDCDWSDNDGWIIPIDSLMILDQVTPETIWRATVDPANEGMADGSYDFVVLTVDVAGNWSWDQNGDWCIDPGYFAYAQANGMGMTVVLQNEAPEVRIRSVNQFEPVDEGWLWPVPVYVQTGDQVTVASWTESVCDVAKVEYWLEGDEIIGGSMLVGVSSDEMTDYAVTFPASGGVGDYLVPGALQNGFVTVTLIAKLTDVLGNVWDGPWGKHWVDVTIIDISPTSALVTNPAPGSYVGHMVELGATVLSGDEIYDVTYEYRPAGTQDWTHIATTRPHDGNPWDTDVNDETIYWNTDLLSDGQYELRAVARNANLITDPEPPVIMVWVDNTAPVVVVDVSPKIVTGTMSEGTTWIGGPFVEIMASVTEAGGVEWVKFWYKGVDDDLGSATCISTDYGAPFAYMWDGSGFTSRTSGWYHIIAEVKDFAGHTTYAMLTVYIDHCDPYGWIAQINSDVTPDGSNFFGILTITGWMDDSDSDCSFTNQLMHSGLAGVQFQYQTDSGWQDLGDFIEDTGPTFTVDWDVSAMVGESISLRIAGVDKTGNWAYSDTVTIYIIDQIEPKAIIAGVDEVSGYVWAAAETHGQNDIGSVRFEYMSATAVLRDEAEWTVIGEVDKTMSDWLYGMPWHFGGLEGDFWVRAVAFDNDYDPEDPDFDDLYDKDPAKMKVTIAGGIVSMAATEEITSLTRWGNLDDCDQILVKAVSVDKPTVIVVYDEYPEDHFNEPYARLLTLERGGDPTAWFDDFSVYDLDYEDDQGIATIIGTHVDQGEVGAVTDAVKLFKVTEEQGSRGAVSQDGVTIDIPAGAFASNYDGLLIITVPELMADPEIEEVVPVGDPVMLTFIDYNACSEYTFQNGMRAQMTFAYNEADIPEGIEEADLRVARWYEGSRYWRLSDLTDFDVDTEANEITFLTRMTGTYSVVAATTFRLATPVFTPRCGEYTGAYPMFCTIIEDLLYGIDTDEIKVVLDGPAEDPIFDNMTIWYDDYAAYGWDGDYDYTAHRLCIWVDEYYDWDLVQSSPDGPSGWSAEGLPAGTYTLDIWAINGIGETKHLETTFVVDAAAPTVAFTDEDGGYASVKYVDTYPTFYLKITDTESGVDLDKVYLDVYVVEPGGSLVEDEERLGTVTPSAMTYDSEAGLLIAEFGEIYRDELPEGLSLDVVVYDGTFTNCTDDDCEYGDCRCYNNDDGVADCAGNHATPVWRRFTVKREDGDGPVEVSDVKTYPNPFDPTSGECATISFTLSRSGHVTIKIYDFGGQYVETVADDWYSSGEHELTWCGTNGGGETVATGAYIGYFKVDDNTKVVTKNLKIGVANGGND